MDALAQARRLGATDAEAQRAIEVLEAAGLLVHGLAVIAVVAAARAGTEPLDALRAMAAGEPPPGEISDYELRVAAEEAEAELQG